MQTCHALKDHTYIWWFAWTSSNFGVYYFTKLIIKCQDLKLCTMTVKHIEIRGCEGHDSICDMMAGPSCFPKMEGMAFEYVEAGEVSSDFISTRYKRFFGGSKCYLSLYGYISCLARSIVSLNELLIRTLELNRIVHKCDKLMSRQVMNYNILIVEHDQSWSCM